MSSNGLSPLRHLNVSAIDRGARKESRNREVHLPPVSVYRWWARRTEAVNGAILDAVAIDHPGRLLVSDPFAGGGVIPLAAMKRGHQVYAQELDPWAVRGLVAMVALPPPNELTDGVDKLRLELADLLENAYATTLSDGTPAWVAHTFRVAVAPCGSCGRDQRLFPHAMVTLLRRQERGEDGAYLACPRGHLFVGSATETAACPACGETTDPKAAYTRGRKVTCPGCGHKETLERRAASPRWRWKVVLVERATDDQREVSTATSAEVAQADNDSWCPSMNLGSIPPGQETAVLLRHGFRTWNDLYPPRQASVLEHLLGAIDDSGLDHGVAKALRSAALGTAEMAGMASRWDRRYLKSFEAMASHRFNFTTLTVEPNVWGTKMAGRGTFIRRIQLLKRASTWLIEHATISEVEGPLRSEERRRRMRSSTQLRVVQGSSERQVLTRGSVSLVLTDPPYHDDVQYGELSLPLRAWADLDTSRVDGEAVANDATGANTEFDAYEDLLRRIFTECRRTLDENGHLIFSYANREPRAWVALFRALDAAGFRACGWAVVHSENETDHAKRNVRACTMDMLLDLVPADTKVEDVWAPRRLPQTPEGAFLGEVGAGFSHIGRTTSGWNGEFLSRLRSTEFIDA